MNQDHLFDFVPIAATVVDSRGHIVAANRAFCGLFGVTSEQIIGNDVLSLYPATAAGWARELHRRIFNAELEVFRSSGFFVTGSGDAERLQVVVCPVDDQPSPAESDPASPRAAIYTFDYGPPAPISDNDSYLQRVLRASRSTLLTLDGDGVVTSVAGSGGAGLAYPIGFWEGRSFVDTLLPGERPRFRAYMATLADHPSRLEDTELRVRAADGSERVILVSGANMMDDPVIAAVVLSVQDVSELHAQITDLVEENRSAETLATQRAELIATVSHELRNPLHALQGLSELLATAQLTPELHDVAAELHTQLTGLSTVTSDLLEAARADRGEIQLVPEVVVLETLLRRAVRYGQAAVATKPVEVIGVLEPNTPEAVMLDPARFDQIVRNLVGNAAKFTAAGSITITFGPIPKGIHLTVADTGPGIPGAEIHKVLEPFARGSNTVEATGAGLGLAIVKQLASSMGGQVLVESTVGKGASFRAEIAARRAVAARPSNPDGGDPTSFDADVLVVDDDRTNRVIATRMLERLGCRVTEAHSGEHALELLTESNEQFPVDAILMDRRMPGMDGLETTRALRKLPHRADVFVVCLSASTSAEERAECFEASMNDFVAKPASLSDLERALGPGIAGCTEPPSQQPLATNTTMGNTTVRKSTVPHDTEQPDTKREDLDQEALVDHQRLRELVVEFDDAELVRSLVEMFVTDLPDQLQQLTDTQANGDVETVSRIAHTIKGSAMMLGASTLAAAAKEVEQSPTDPADQFVSIAGATKAQFEDALADDVFGGVQ